MTALLRERASSMVLDDDVDELSLELAELEHRLAVALTELNLGEFADHDQRRLLALVPRIPAEFSPLAAIVRDSLGVGTP